MISLKVLSAAAAVALALPLFVPGESFAQQRPTFGGEAAERLPVRHSVEVAAARLPVPHSAEVAARSSEAAPHPARPSVAPPVRPSVAAALSLVRPPAAPPLRPGRGTAAADGMADMEAVTDITTVRWRLHPRRGCRCGDRRRAGLVELWLLRAELWLLR